MGLIKSAARDAVLTFLWVLNLPFVGLLTRTITTVLGLQPLSLITLFIRTIAATINVTLFSTIGQALGGASFNPTTSVCIYTAGINEKSSLTSMAIRLPAQAAAGVLGVMAVLEVMPGQYKNMLKGPFLKVDLHAGAIAEGIMTFVHNFAILMVFTWGPQLLVLKVWLVACTTVGLAVWGSGYTGPSLNPANAFGWAYVNNRHNTWEHFYVYGICPLSGAVLAARVFQGIFSPTVKKQKKA